MKEAHVPGVYAHLWVGLSVLVLYVRVRQTNARQPRHDSKARQQGVQADRTGRARCRAYSSRLARQGMWPRGRPTGVAHGPYSASPAHVQTVVTVPTICIVLAVIVLTVSCGNPE